MTTLVVGSSVAGSSVVRSWTLVLVLAAALMRPGLVAAQEPPAPPLPPNIEYGPALDPTLRHLVQKSSTFAQQCARIAAAPHVRIAIVVVAAPRESLGPRARSYITRHAFGALRVLVEIPMTVEHVELIGHEFEHIIEQIEGLDLPGLARAGRDGVVEIADGVYETARARAAGLAVANEALGAPTGGQRVSDFLRGLRARLARDAPATGMSRR